MPVLKKCQGPEEKQTDNELRASNAYDRYEKALKELEKVLQKNLPSKDKK